MFKTIVLKGHYRWIVPLAIVLITIYLTSCYNNIEPFDIGPTLSKMMDKFNKVNGKEVNGKEINGKEIMEKKSPEKVLKDIEKEIKKDKKEIKKTKNKKEVNKVLDLVKTLETKINNLKSELKDDKEANKDLKLLKGLEKEIGNILNSKEHYENFSNIKSIKKKKDITGYNSGEYELNFEAIFPNRKVNNTKKVKFKDKPDIIGYETDINKKILEYESTNGLVLSTYKPHNLTDRPKYMYNRHDGSITPHITDDNRFDISQFNVFKG